MSLRERVGHWILGKRATDAIIMHPSHQAYYGAGVGKQPAHSTLLEENMGVADMATRAIANRVGTLVPQVKVTRRIADGTTEDEILDDHMLAVLLGRPHPNLSWFQLARLTAQYIVTVGEGYWLKVGNGLGVAVELHPIPANKIFPLLQKNIVTGYRITDADGRIHDVRATDVVRFFFPDPENIWGSEGYLGPNGVTTDAMKFAGQHLRAHYQNDATPKTALEVAYPEIATQFDVGQAERFSDLWRDRYHARSGTKQGGPGLLPFGYKLVQMAWQSGADIRPLLEFWSDEQLMNFGTPKSILGKVVSGDRSSAETNQYVFDRYTVLPIATLLAEGMTHQLAKDYDPDLFVDFEDFVSADKDFELRQEETDLRTKVRSINQVREDRALDPVPWGEDPVGSFSDVPYDPDMTYEMDEDQPEALGGSPPGEPPAEEERMRDKGGMRPDPAKFKTKQDFMATCVKEMIGKGKTKEAATAHCNEKWGDRSEEDRQKPISPKGYANKDDFMHDCISHVMSQGVPHPKAVSQCNAVWENRAAWAELERADHFSPQAEWQRQVIREKKYVPSFERELRMVFGKQERKIKRRLKKLVPRGRVGAAELFMEEDWDKLFERHLEPIRIKAFEAILSETLDAFGMESFALTDEMRFLLEQQGALLVKYANRTTQNLVAHQLAEATAEGEGVDSMLLRITRVFRTRRKHARTIARTEILKASQEAQIAGFDVSGVVEKKQWNTSRDRYVRDQHVPMDGVIVGLHELFDVGGELAISPGIGMGHLPLSAGNAINCRCFITPVLE